MNKEEDSKDCGDSLGGQKQNTTQKIDQKIQIDKLGSADIDHNRFMKQSTALNLENLEEHRKKSDLKNIETATSFEQRQGRGKVRIENSTLDQRNFFEPDKMNEKKTPRNSSRRNNQQKRTSRMTKAKSQRHPKQKDETNQTAQDSKVGETTEKSETKKGGGGTTVGALSSTKEYNFDLLEQQAQTNGIEKQLNLMNKRYFQQRVQQVTDVGGLSISEKNEFMLQKILNYVREADEVKSQSQASRKKLAKLVAENPKLKFQKTPVVRQLESEINMMPDLPSKELSDAFFGFLGDKMSKVPHVMRPKVLQLACRYKKGSFKKMITKLTQTKPNVFLIVEGSAMQLGSDESVEKFDQLMNDQKNLKQTKLQIQQKENEKALQSVGAVIIHYIRRSLVMREIIKAGEKRQKYKEMQEQMKNTGLNRLKEGQTFGSFDPLRQKGDEYYQPCAVVSIAEPLHLIELDLKIMLDMQHEMIKSDSFALIYSSLQNQGIGTHIVKRFSKFFYEHKLIAGTLLIKENEPVEELYLIKSGQCKVYSDVSPFKVMKDLENRHSELHSGFVHNPITGENLNLALDKGQISKQFNYFPLIEIGEGSWVGEETYFLEQSVLPYNIRAQTEITVLQIGRKDFSRFMSLFKKEEIENFRDATIQKQLLKTQRVDDILKVSQEVRDLPKLNRFCEESLRTLIRLYPRATRRIMNHMGSVMLLEGAIRTQRRKDAIDIGLVEYDQEANLKRAHEMLALKASGQIKSNPNKKMDIENEEEEMLKIITKVKTKAQPLDPTGVPVQQESKGRQKLMQQREKAYLDQVLKEKNLKKSQISSILIDPDEVQTFQEQKQQVPIQNSPHFIFGNGNINHQSSSLAEERDKLLTIDQRQKLIEQSNYQLIESNNEVSKSPKDLAREKLNQMENEWRNSPIMMLRWQEFEENQIKISQSKRFDFSTLKPYLEEDQLYDIKQMRDVSRAKFMLGDSLMLPENNFWSELSQGDLQPASEVFMGSSMGRALQKVNPNKRYRNTSNYSNQSLQRQQSNSNSPQRTSPFRNSKQEPIPGKRIPGWHRPIRTHVPQSHLYRSVQISENEILQVNQQKYLNHVSIQQQSYINKTSSPRLIQGSQDNTHRQYDTLSNKFSPRNLDLSDSKNFDIEPRISQNISLQNEAMNIHTAQVSPKDSLSVINPLNLDSKAKNNIVSSTQLQSPLNLQRLEIGLNDKLAKKNNLQTLPDSDDYQDLKHEELLKKQLQSNIKTEVDTEYKQHDINKTPIGIRLSKQKLDCTTLSNSKYDTNNLTSPFKNKHALNSPHKSKEQSSNYREHLKKSISESQKDQGQSSETKKSQLVDQFNERMRKKHVRDQKQMDGEADLRRASLKDMLEVDLEMPVDEQTMMQLTLDSQFFKNRHKERMLLEGASKADVQKNRQSLVLQQKEIEQMEHMSPSFGSRIKHQSKLTKANLRAKSELGSEILDHKTGQIPNKQNDAFIAPQGNHDVNEEDDQFSRDKNVKISQNCTPDNKNETLYNSQNLVSDVLPRSTSKLSTKILEIKTRQASQNAATSKANIANSVGKKSNRNAIQNKKGDENISLRYSFSVKNDEQKNRTQLIISELKNNDQLLPQIVQSSQRVDDIVSLVHGKSNPSNSIKISSNKFKNTQNLHNNSQLRKSIDFVSHVEDQKEFQQTYSQSKSGSHSKKISQNVIAGRSNANSRTLDPIQVSRKAQNLRQSADAQLLNQLIGDRKNRLINGEIIEGPRHKHRQQALVSCMAKKGLGLRYGGIKSSKIGQDFLGNNSNSRESDPRTLAGRQFSKMSGIVYTNSNKLSRLANYQPHPNPSTKSNRKKLHLGVKNNKWSSSLVNSTTVEDHNEGAPTGRDGEDAEEQYYSGRSIQQADDSGFVIQSIGPISDVNVPNNRYHLDETMMNNTLEQSSNQQNMFFIPGLQSGTKLSIESLNSLPKQIYDQTISSIMMPKNSNLNSPFNDSKLANNQKISNKLPLFGSTKGNSQLDLQSSIQHIQQSVAKHQQKELPPTTDQISPSNSGLIINSVQAQIQSGSQLPSKVTISEQQSKVTLGVNGASEMKKIVKLGSTNNVHNQNNNIAHLQSASQKLNTDLAAVKTFKNDDFKAQRQLKKGERFDLGSASKLVQKMADQKRKSVTENASHLFSKQSGPRSKKVINEGGAVNGGVGANEGATTFYIEQSASRLESSNASVNHKHNSTLHEYYKHSAGFQRSQVSTAHQAQNILDLKKNSVELLTNPPNINYAEISLQRDPNKMSKKGEEPSLNRRNQANVMESSISDIQVIREPRLLSYNQSFVDKQDLKKLTEKFDEDSAQNSKRASNERSKHIKEVKNNLRQKDVSPVTDNNKAGVANSHLSPNKQLTVAASRQHNNPTKQTHPKQKNSSTTRGKGSIAVLANETGEYIDSKMPPNTTTIIKSSQGQGQGTAIAIKRESRKGATKKAGNANNLTGSVVVASRGAAQNQTNDSNNVGMMNGTVVDLVLPQLADKMQSMPPNLATVGNSKQKRKELTPLTNENQSQNRKARVKHVRKFVKRQVDQQNQQQSSQNYEDPILADVELKNLMSKVNEKTDTVPNLRQQQFVKRIHQHQQANNKEGTGKSSMILPPHKQHFSGIDVTVSLESLLKNNKMEANGFLQNQEDYHLNGTIDSVMDPKMISAVRVSTPTRINKNNFETDMNLFDSIASGRDSFEQLNANHE